MLFFPVFLCVLITGVYMYIKEQTRENQLMCWMAMDRTLSMLGNYLKFEIPL